MVIQTETEVKQVVGKRKILISFAGVAARWSRTVESMVDYIVLIPKLYLRRLIAL